MKAIAKLLFAAARRTPQFRGKHGVLWKAVRSLPAHDDFLIESGGAAFSVRGIEINEFWMAAKGIHSPEIFQKICEVAGEGEVTVWDVGANIGTSSLPLLAAKPRLKIVAFEPSPEVCARFLKNAALNPRLASRLTIVNCALSDKSEWVRFYSSNEKYNSGVGGIGSAGNRSKGAFWTFAQVGSGINIGTMPDIIKIDVEGHELAVLRGLGEILNRRPLTIIFEHSNYRLNEGSSALDAVTSFLAGEGFTITTLSGEKVIDLRLDQDLVAYKR